MNDLEIIDAKYNEDDNTVYVYAIKETTLSSVTFTTILENESMDTA